MSPGSDTSTDDRSDIDDQKEETHRKHVATPKSARNAKPPRISRCDSERQYDRRTPRLIERRSRSAGGTSEASNAESDDDSDVDKRTGSTRRKSAGTPRSARETQTSRKSQLKSQRSSDRKTPQSTKRHTRRDNDEADYANDNPDDSSDAGNGTNDGRRKRPTTPRKTPKKPQKKEQDKKKPEVKKPALSRDIKPNKFNGKGSVETFMAQFAICASHNHWSDAEKTAQLKCCIVDEAASVIWDSGNAEEVTYGELMEKLQRRYGCLDQQEKYEAELRARRRREKETLPELYQDIRCMMVKAYPGQTSSPLYERTAKEHFLAALKDRELASKIREKEVKTLEDAFKQALRLEALKRADEDAEANQTGNQQPQQELPRTRNRPVRDEYLTRRINEVIEQKLAPVMINPPPPVQVHDPGVEELKRQVTEMSKQIGRLQATQPHNITAQPITTSQNLQSRQIVATQATATPPRTETRNCFKCGAIGHLIKDCNQTSNKRQNGHDYTAAAVSTVIGQTKGTSLPEESRLEKRIFDYM